MRKKTTPVKTIRKADTIPTIEWDLSGAENWPADHDWQNIIAELFDAVDLEALSLPDTLKNYDHFELAILLAHDTDIRDLNKNYRGKDKPTNVLSFATIDDPDYEHLEPTLPYPLGDVILSLETLEREAKEQEKTLKNHFIHLVLHGFLHLIGRDHITDDEAERMEKTEIEILARLDIPNPYEPNSNEPCTHEPDALARS